MSGWRIKEHAVTGLHPLSSRAIRSLDGRYSHQEGCLGTLAWLRQNFFLPSYLLAIEWHSWLKTVVECFVGRRPFVNLLIAFVQPSSDAVGKVGLNAVTANLFLLNRTCLSIAVIRAFGRLGSDLRTHAVWASNSSPFNKISILHGTCWFQGDYQTVLVRSENEMRII